MLLDETDDMCYDTKEVIVMRDIPVFATEYGVASLVLQEIPYSKTAYIKFQDTAQPEAFLKECKDFCVMAGAEKIYAAGHAVVETFPVHATIYQMHRHLAGLEQTDAVLIPVQEQTLQQWKTIYNQKMANVPNAAYMTDHKAKQMLKKGEGYFVCRNENLLGIGMTAGNRIDAVAAVLPGAGRDIVLALCSALSGDFVVLDVAVENEKAVRLYEQLGFVIKSELSKWYKIF